MQNGSEIKKIISKTHIFEKMKNDPSHEIGGENKFGAIWTTFFYFFGRQKSRKKVSKIFKSRFLKISSITFAEIFNRHGEAYWDDASQISCQCRSFCRFEPRWKKAPLPKL